MGTGIGHSIPFVAYLGFWVMILLSLFKDPKFGMYYMIPFLPYRTMRDHFLDWPLGGNVLTILVIAVVVGALLRGKRPPKGRVYLVWLIFGIYTYFSMWLGVVMVSAPLPLWLSDINFVTWKDYMLMPLILLAAGMVLEDRKSIRTAILITAFSVVMIDRSSLMDSLSHSWTTFDENKRSGGPLGYGSNQTAAFLAQFAMFFWGFALFLKRRKAKLLSYGVAALTIMATMYCFSRGAYLAVLVSVFVLGLIKDRKLLVIAGVFLLTWQAVVPKAVTERVNMTHNESGQLEESAQERVELWTNAEDSILHNPVFGTGFASFQFGEHVGGLKDTHNWYVKVLVETGVIGFVIALALLQSMYSVGIQLFRKATDPLYRGLGIGLIVCFASLTVANFFGDRWTYLEINGMLWVLVGAATRASALTAEALPATLEEPAPEVRLPAYAHA